MLSTVKSYILGLEDIPFYDYYQEYIFYVQDVNIETEVRSIKPNDVISLDKLIAKLHRELMQK